MPTALFGTRKVLGKGKKDVKENENDFLMLGLTMENIKENQIQSKVYIL